MKKHVLFAVAALLCSGTCFTAVEYSASHIGLDIQNQSRKALWVAVLNGNNLYQPMHIPAKALQRMSSIASLSLKIDISQPTKLAVWYKDPGEIEYQKTKREGFVDAENFTPKPNKLYTVTRGKTIYIIWDPADFPRPQAGKRGGVSETTESHLNLKLNVIPTDIKEEIV